LVDPTLQGLRAVPSIAWVPLFILWFGIFEASKIILIAAGVFFPGSVNGFDKQGQIPTTYNWNATIQRELPWSILFDIASRDTVWLRVPLYAGDVASINPNGDAGVGSLGEWGRTTPYKAKPVKDQPPTATAAARDCKLRRSVSPCCGVTQPFWTRGESRSQVTCARSRLARACCSADLS